MSQNLQMIDSNTAIGAHPRHRLDVSAEQLVKEMDRYKMVGALTLATVGIYHDFMRGNSITLEAAKSSNRLVPIATVDPKHYFGSAEDMQKVRAQGFRIFKFFPQDQGWAINSAAFGEILKQLAPLKSPIMVDIGDSGDASSLGRMTANYPAAVIMCSITVETLTEAMAVMAEIPQMMIETHALTAPGALELLVSKGWADRIVFGSNAPRLSIASSLQYIFSSELNDEDKQKILGSNIKKILEAT